MYTRRMVLTGSGAVAGAVLGGLLRPHVSRAGWLSAPARRMMPGVAASGHGVRP